MMHLLLLSFVLWGNALKPTAVPVQYVDVIEINHYKPQLGGVMTQLIFRNWSHDYHRTDIVGWRLVRTDFVGSVPIKVGGYWEYRDVGPVNGIVIKVRAKDCIVTETDYDPERRERRLFQEHHRLGLLNDMRVKAIYEATDWVPFR